MSQKKYELVSGNHPEGLFNIRALIDIPKWSVKAGDIGGWVESESNLAQNGEGWIDAGSVVKGKAVVKNALVAQLSRIEGNVKIDRAMVLATNISGNVTIAGTKLTSSDVTGDSKIEGTGVIQRSTLHNVSIMGDHTIHQTVLKADSHFQAKSRQIWEDVDLYVQSGYVSQLLEMKSVKGMVGSFVIEQMTELTSVEFHESKTTFQTGISNVNLISQTSMMGGEEPIQVHAEVLELVDVEIEGAVTLRGLLILHDSSISDYAILDCNATISDSTIKDCASIILPHSQYRNMGDLEMAGDEQLSETAS